MNITEKQKFCLISYMKQHPDFGRGRLRYNSENKRKIDELWEKLSLTLNMAGYGPRKSSKEWAKTWRDWKSNVLKKMAKHKTYMMGTGGGSPKELQLSSTENALLNFLTPDASGLNEILEGGFTNTMPTYDNNETLSSFSFSYNIEEKENEVEEIFSNDYSNDALPLQYEMHSPIQQTKQHVQSVLSLHTNIPVKQKRRGIQTNTKVKKYDNTFVSSLSNLQDVHQSKENWEQDNKMCGFSLDDTEKYITKQSEDIKKPRLMATAINLLEKKSTLSENIKQKMLELKKEKLEVKKEELTVFKEILQQLQNMNDFVSSLREELLGQYLTTDISTL